MKTPVRAPKANAVAERFVRTVRSECLDWLLILNRRHLERVLRVYIDHYNTQRPHRALRFGVAYATSAIFGSCSPRRVQARLLLGSRHVARYPPAESP